MSLKADDSDYHQLSKDEIKKRIEKLKELAKNDDILRKYRQDEGWIFQFLISNNFDVNEAFQKMLEYVAFLKDYAEWVADKPPIEMSTQFERKYVAFLHERDNEKRGIIVVKFGNFSTEYTPQDHSHTMETVVDHTHYLYSDLREHGLSAILDMKNLSLKLISWCTPSNVKAAVKIIETYPTPSILIHVVNTAFALDIAIKIIWPFLPEKIKKMVKFHYTDWSSLHEYISPNLLPMEYGGTLPNVDYEESNQRFYTDNAIIEERIQLRKALKT